MVEIPEDLRDTGGTPALDAIRTLRQQLELNRDFGWDMPVAAEQGRVPVDVSPPAGETGVAERETASAPASPPGQD